MGRIEWFEVDPAPGIRLESGVESGSEVSSFYDPMLAKVIAHGPTREVAAATLATSLEGLRVAGVPTNRESLAAILRSPAFLSGDTTTAFLEEHPETAVPVLERRELALHLAAAALGLAEQERVGQPWAALAPAGWRNIPAVPEVRRFGYSEFGADLSIEVHYTRDRAGGVDIVLAGDGVGTDQDPAPVEMGADAPRASAEAALLDEGPEETESTFVVGLPPLPAQLRVDRTRAEGATVMVEVDGVGGWFTVRRAGDWALVTGLGRTTGLKVLPRHPDASDHGHDHGLVTPVPGTVTAVLVEPGAHVASGDTLVILEAMKMEHRIKADEDGVVAEVRVAVGDSVDAHHVVAVLEEE
jgi:propionyl-CoA carboxylase alpha chain